ncbi:MAG: YceI family protein, partial [Chloroflexota bacterium]
ADQVAGQMRFDTNDLSTAEIGIIQINARTFVTDDNRRNNAIQNRILQTGEHEFITFTPTNITRLPESVSHIHQAKPSDA